MALDRNTKMKFTALVEVMRGLREAGVLCEVDPSEQVKCCKFLEGSELYVSSYNANFRRKKNC